MRALPNDRRREFVRHFITGKPGHGAITAAYRAAGFGKNSTPTNAAKEAHKLSHDERVIAAIAEEARKMLRVAHPEAIQALLNLVRDEKHPGHVRAVTAIIDRTDPIVTRHDLRVTHRVIDHDQAALEELRALRKLGTSREKLLELYGPNGLDRIEALEADAMLQRTAKAKMIEAEVIEAETIEPVPHDEPDAEMLGDHF
jgi:hypothetical protein